jgi:sulfatase modifying factor 1
MRVLWSFAILLIVQAGAHGDTFGSGLNQLDIEFVSIGNPGNWADMTGYPNPVGSVPYTFSMAKYEIRESFVDKANNLGGLNLTKDGRGPDKPATNISWTEAAKFVNWLNSIAGRPSAYKFDVGGVFQLWDVNDPGYDPNNRYRNSRAKYFLPSVDEWYKAAYYDPTNNIYYDYPTGSDSIPDGVDFLGDTAYDAVFREMSFIPNSPFDVENAGVLSPSGTVAQGGNVYEVLETSFDGLNNSVSSHRFRRGGAYEVNSLELRSLDTALLVFDTSQADTGFRVVSRVPIPEPRTILLLLVSLIANRIRWRR